MKYLRGILLAGILLAASAAPARAGCGTTKVNLQGSGNASITIDATAGGVLVMAAATSKRCGATIQNSGAAAMRCAPTSVTVSATVGYLIASGASYNAGPEGQQAWKCIRTTGSSTTADVAEATP